MSAWRAERFSFLEEVTAFLNLRDLRPDQFKVVVASDNAQQPFVVFIQQNEPLAQAEGETVAEVAAPAGGAIEAAEAIVADAQREDET